MKKEIQEEVKMPSIDDRINELKQKQEEAKTIFNQCSGAIMVLEDMKKEKD